MSLENSVRFTLEGVVDFMGKLDILTDLSILGNEELHIIAESIRTELIEEDDFLENKL